MEPRNVVLDAGVHHLVQVVLAARTDLALGERLLASVRAARGGGASAEAPAGNRDDRALLFAEEAEVVLVAGAAGRRRSRPR